jgi:broad specificity phosphatase PhoE
LVLKRDFTFRLFILLLAFTQQALAADNSADEAVWSALKSGQHVVLIRHAITEPGIGDPPGFVHGKCSTQRNLSAQGRLDAKRIGEAFRSRNIPISDVLSSRWCRCLDTANLAFGKATPSPMLDSMFNDREKPADEKVREVFAAVNRRPSSGNLVLITHNQNIQALTGVSPASGEMVVVTPENGKFRVIGRLNLSS